jgi:cytoskeletal protein CcmA (bactofilin family)
MWKAQDSRPTLNPSQPAQPSPTPVVHAPNVAAGPKETPRTAERGDVGHIGKSVVIRGELTGSEDLYLDGEVEGNINLRDYKLVVGPNAKIKATITARDVIVHGRVEGNISGSERVELKRACTLIGDVATQRIAIEDGAYFKGAIDVKESRESKGEVRKPVAAASVINGAAGPALSASTGTQGSFLEPK